MKTYTIENGKPTEGILIQTRELSSYEKVWTVDTDSNREYVEKRKTEAAEASHYFDGLIRYEMENCYEEADEINEESFRVVSADGYDDTYLIAFCDIPQEAYFLKLTRID